MSLRNHVFWQCAEKQCILDPLGSLSSLAHENEELMLIMITEDSLPKLCNFTGLLQVRTFFYSSGPFFLSPKEVFWFMIASILGVWDALEEISVHLRLWWPGVPGILKGLYGKNLLAKMLDTNPNTIHKMILLLSCPSEVCGSTTLFTLPENMLYWPEQTPGIAL